MVTGNNTHCRIVGLKRVRTMTFNRIVRALDEVRHVPNLKRNLISFSIFFIQKGIGTLMNVKS